MPAFRSSPRPKPLVRGLLAAGLGALAVLAAPAHAAPAPDLATPAGFQRTCAAQPPQLAAQASDEARLAWVICRDVDLVRDLITWGTRGAAALNQGHADEAQVVAEVTRKLDEVREHLRRSRLQLERVKLKGASDLWLAPGQWQLDLDSNGRQEAWETWFFALPRRHDGPAEIRLPDNDAERYQATHDATLRIRVDQADVEWALAYHQFIEGLLTAVRAFDLDLKQLTLELRRPALLPRAHALIAQGLASSERMRRSVLAETDDDHEWVPNLRQRDTAFPVPLTAADFETWAQSLQALSAVWQGRHLLPTAAGAGGVLGAVAPVCAPGQGLDVALLLRSPPAAGLRLTLDRPPALARRYCRAVDAAHPLSPLPGQAERRLAEGSGLSALRYLYWIN